MPYDNPLLEKSLKFASRIVKLYQYLLKEKHESIISKQIIRSGTYTGCGCWFCRNTLPKRKATRLSMTVWKSSGF